MPADDRQTDHRRHSALADMGLLTGSVPQEFQDRCERIRTQFRVATVLVNLVDHDELIVAARAGLDLGKQPPRQDAFSGYAIRSEEVFVVPDATKDPRFTSHPLVTGEPGVRFYAGAPLIYNRELRLGCLCLFDTKPREFSLGDRAELAEVTDGLISVLIQRHIGRFPPV